MARSRDNQIFVESGNSFSDRSAVGLRVGVHRPELTPWPLLVARGVPLCTEAQALTPPQPQVHVHNYIRFSQPARWPRVAETPMAAEVDRPLCWQLYRAVCRGRIASVPAGFAGGGIFHTAATPQHGIAPARGCRFTAGTEKWAHHALRMVKTVRRGKAHFPATAFTVYSISTALRRDV